MLYSFLLVGKEKVMRENKFQSNLKKEIEKRFPGCMIFKLDTSDRNGIPDLLVLYKDKWATLECKRSRNASLRNHQDFYVNKMNNMSFSRFIFPENKEEVLDELQQSFSP